MTFAIEQMLSLSARETASAVDVPTKLQRYIIVSPLQQKKIQQQSEIRKPRVFDTFRSAFDQLENRVLLLGIPGAGKTTTLLQFACAAAQERLEDATKPIPIFRSIQQWDHQTSLLDWARVPLLTKFKDIRLENESFLYIFDGLDELGGERPLNANNPEA